MGTSAIDLMQSSDIAQLQTDVTELNTKLNALIVEFNKCSDDTTTNKGKIDSLITDVGDINDKISGSYTPATDDSNYGNSTDSILLRLERLDQDFVNLDNSLKGHKAGNYTSTEVHNVGSPSSGRTGAGSDNLNGIDELSTPTSGTGDDTSVNASSSSVGGVYTTAPIKVLTLGNKPEARARKLARKTLNRLRK